MLPLRPRAVLMTVNRALQSGVQARCITTSATNLKENSDEPSAQADGTPPVRIIRQADSRTERILGGKSGNRGDRRPNRGSDSRGERKPNPESASHGQRNPSRQPESRGEREPNRQSDSFGQRNPDRETTRSHQTPKSKREAGQRSHAELFPRLADKPMSLMTLADLSTAQISSLIKLSLTYKALNEGGREADILTRLHKKSIALIFNKRSTRTRVASETAVTTLGGSALFLGKDDIQLGVNESLEDSARIIGSMTAGIMARVGEHVEVETLAEKAGVPVINALSDLWHPTQILADIMTMHEILTPAEKNPLANWKQVRGSKAEKTATKIAEQIDPLAALQGKKIVWVGDVNNVLNDMLVSLPRLGMTMAVAAPQGYDKVDPRVWKRVEEAGTADKILITNSPGEALKDADFVVTDTWISMGQEAEKEARLKAFAGFQVTEKLCQDSGAKPDWKFLHCLPRKAEEVDDEVFYGPRSHVFREGENRKWTIMALFGKLFAQWTI